MLIRVIFLYILFFGFNSFAEDTLHKKRTLSIGGICSMGFGMAAGGWVEFKDAKQEADCDASNLRGFLRAMGRQPANMLPGESSLPVVVTPYDINGDKKADCRDFRAWKIWIKKEFRDKRRKTDGSSLQLKECP